MSTPRRSRDGTTGEQGDTGSSDAGRAGSTLGASPPHGDGDTHGSAAGGGAGVEHPGPVSLLHVDGDLYSSAVTVLEHVGPRLVPGSVVVFDEFFNFPGWEQHEFRAWQEHLARTGARVAYEAYTSNGEQVVARVLDPGTSTGG